VEELEDSPPFLEREPRRPLGLPQGEYEESRVEGRCAEVGRETTVGEASEKTVVTIGFRQFVIASMIIEVEGISQAVGGAVCALVKNDIHERSNDAVNGKCQSNDKQDVGLNDPRCNGSVFRVKGLV